LNLIRLEFADEKKSIDDTVPGLPSQLDLNKPNLLDRLRDMMGRKH
jgi:hypothetical protein